MDYQDNNSGSGSGEALGQGDGADRRHTVTEEPPKRKKSGWRIFWGIFLGLSVLGNIVFFLMVIGLVAIVVTGQADMLTEKVLVSGPRSNKIAVINIDGVIDSAVAQDVIEKIQHAAGDQNVKALILSVDSPGGTISASDRIYNEIATYRNEQSKPVVGFMRGLAASGGYYVSVAADEIVAEPTTITGSVGVIMGYLVLEDLLEGKLGIEPVIIKSGRKKDWPSSFRSPSEQELSYLQEKVVDPAFERFKQIVADGRMALGMEDVNELADGSVFSADEALAEDMIDHIGYFDDAVGKAKELANIDKAQVIEYTRPFSLGSLLGARTKTIFELDRTTLYELSTPQVLYLWSLSTN